MKNLKRNLLAHSVILASAGQFSAATLANFELEEVIVTATKRAQSTMDVPYNISATTSETLEQRGIVDFSKLAQTVPGLAYIDTGSRDSGINSGLIIRGLNTTSSGFTDFATIAAPTVSVYIDETPLFYNVYLKDVERVEVLRGPQGTLYGSGSLGGTIRYINKKPDVEATYAEFHSRVSTTDESSGLNSDTFAVINAAVADNFALRGVIGYVENQGFIDAKRLGTFDSNNQPISANPADMNSPILETSKKDSNSEMFKHAKLSALWDISDTVTARLSYQTQQDSIDDRQVANDQNAAGGDYVHLQRVRESAERKLDLIALEIEADLGFATLTSATSSFESSSDLVGDQTAAYYNAGYWETYSYSGFPREAVIGNYAKDVEVVSQEIRLTSNTDGDIDWIVGAFYLKQEVEIQNRDFHRGFYQWSKDIGNTYETLGDYYADRGQVTELENRNQPTDLFYVLNQYVENVDKAIFGEVTYHFSDAWQATFGARFFKQEFSNITLNQSPLCGFYCSDDEEDSRGLYGSENAFDTNDQIFKFNTSYDVTDEIMVYTTVAQGYRNGGANGIPSAGYWGEPEELITYEHDTALSFELGAKGTAWDDRIRFSGALFRIDWDDVIITTESPNGFTILTNGDTARSQGIELESTIAFTENFQSTIGYTYADAKLTSGFNDDNEDDADAIGIVGHSGDKLPGVPEQMLTVSLTYNQLIGDTELVYNLNGSYVDEVTTDINATNDNFTVVDGYSVFSGSVFWEVSDSLSLSLFADNLTNERAPTNTRGPKYSREDSTQRDIYSYVMRPRTIGLGVKYLFE
jgi:iron complex outermembrane recepter protein